jgi:hypothetical protein
MSILNKITTFAIKTAKVVSGVQAYQDRKEAKRLKEEAEELYKDTMEENEARRESANNELTAFGRVRLESLQDTVGVFLSYLKIMKHNFTEKEYELSGVINLKDEEVNSMESVELTARESLEATAVAGSVAAAAIAGVPTAVTGAVSALATASTGTAISTLHGAAAYNATMAWLGGGSMATGATTLTAITGVSAGVFALAAIGVVAGMHYSKKLAAATKNYEEMCEYREKAECAWALMDGIVKRAHELQNITLKLRECIHNQLNLLEPLIYDFVADDPYYVETFQQTALLVKTMSELSQIPVLDEKGYVSQSSKLEIVKVNKILNREL